MNKKELKEIKENNKKYWGNLPTVIDLLIGILEELMLIKKTLKENGKP